jgi:NAD(P) transhydrogenase
VKLALDRGELLKVDAVLVAAGRTANTGRLNLPAVGVTPGAKGKLDVNENYQTNVPHIYATGDVIGFPALASTGMQQSRVAMAHSFAPSIGLKMDRILPYGIYSVPECGMVGETEQSLKQQNVPYVAGVAKYSHTGRGVIIGDQYGFLKLLFHADTRKLLGVHAIGENASDLIHVGQMVMLYDGGIDAFARACFNYPTLGDLYKHAAGTAMAAFMKRDAQRAETAPVGL